MLWLKTFHTVVPVVKGLSGAAEHHLATWHQNLTGASQALQVFSGCIDWEPPLWHQNFVLIAWRLHSHILHPRTFDLLSPTVKSPRGDLLLLEAHLLQMGTNTVAWFSNKKAERRVQLRSMFWFNGLIDHDFNFRFHFLLRWLQYDGPCFYSQVYGPQ